MTLSDKKPPRRSKPSGVRRPRSENPADQSANRYGSRPKPNSQPSDKKRSGAKSHYRRKPNPARQGLSSRPQAKLARRVKMGPEDGLNRIERSDQEQILPDIQVQSVTDAALQDKPKPSSAPSASTNLDKLKKRKNKVVGLILLGLVGLFFAITVTRLKMGLS
jgi:hypothetical protein